jgi:hypothetical protein
MVSFSEVAKRFVDEFSTGPIPKAILVNVHGSLLAIDLHYDRAQRSVEVDLPHVFSAKYSDSPARSTVVPN